MPKYWLGQGGADFGAYYGASVTASKAMPHENFLTVMEEQVAIAKKLFDKISEDDLQNKEVVYPWNGVKAALGEAIIATSIKWLAAYKLQLFLFVKLCADKQLATADAWVLTELPA